MPPTPKAAVIIGCIDGILPASDRAATALAVTQFGDVVVLCSPRGEEAALRYGLGAGARDVVPIEECNALVYLVGRGGAGVDGDLMVAQLATARHAALVLDVLDVEACADGVRVRRDLGRGAREELTVTGPAVLMVADDAPQRMYVSRFRQMMAAPPPVEAAANQPISWGPVRLRAKTADLTGRTAGAARDRMFAAFGLNDGGAATDAHIITADAEVCAEHLVRYLAHHGFVDRHFAAADAPVERSEHRQASAVMPNVGHTLSDSSHVRSPRAVQGPAGGLHRRPRPYRPTAGRLGKLLRGPRPPGLAQPPRVRGPFPVSTMKVSTHG